MVRLCLILDGKQMIKRISTKHDSSTAKVYKKVKGSAQKRKSQNPNVLSIITSTWQALIALIK